MKEVMYKLYDHAINDITEKKTNEGHLKTQFFLSKCDIIKNISFKSGGLKFTLPF
jgi:hypothetical protein